MRGWTEAEKQALRDAVAEELASPQANPARDPTEIEKRATGSLNSPAKTNIHQHLHKWHPVTGLFKKPNAQKVEHMSEDEALDYHVERHRARKPADDFPHIHPTVDGCLFSDIVREVAN